MTHHDHTQPTDDPAEEAALIEAARAERQAIAAMIAAGNDPGWHDEHGNPAPWPEDFFDDDSGWRPWTGDPVEPAPGEPPF